MCPAGGLLPSIASNEHEIEVRERETKKKKRGEQRATNIIDGIIFLHVLFFDWLKSDCGLFCQ